eukprot:g9301.t1
MHLAPQVALYLPRVTAVEERFVSPSATTVSPSATAIHGGCGHRCGPDVVHGKGDALPPRERMGLLGADESFRTSGYSTSHSRTNYVSAHSYVTTAVWLHAGSRRRYGQYHTSDTASTCSMLPEQEAAEDCMNNITNCDEFLSTVYTACCVENCHAVAGVATPRAKARRHPSKVLDNTRVLSAFNAKGFGWIQCLDGSLAWVELTDCHDHPHKLFFPWQCGRC